MIIKQLMNWQRTHIKKFNSKNVIIQYYCEYIKYTERVDNDKPYNEILRETITYLKRLRKELNEIGKYIGYSFDIREFDEMVKKQNPWMNEKTN